MAGHPSLCEYGRSCEVLFRRLCDGWRKTTIPDCNHIPLAAISKESERFDTWARNIAALQNASLPSSLEHRLRNDQGALEKVRKALVYLEESLELALSIISGEKQNETWILSALDISEEATRAASPNSSSRGSEIAELYLSIQDGVTNLFRLSMIIRKKPQIDEYVKAESRSPNMDTVSDIMRVGDKYTKLRNGDSWLRERLGIAITRRRQYLLYRREHQENMEKEHVMRVGPDGRTLWTGEKASTYTPLEETSFPNLQDKSQPITLAQQTDFRTTYADSRFEKDRSLNVLRTPLLPKDRNGNRVQFGEHFECPYCWRPTIVADKRHWKKHIMSDLRPYLCTFESCGLVMFESQHEWFQHELQFHRKQWKCQICIGDIEQTLAGLRQHVFSIHPDISIMDLDYFIEHCQIPRVDSASCPLCVEWGSKLHRVNGVGNVSLKQYQEHLGRHMEQLAMAALPPEDDRSDESESEQEIPSLLPSATADDKSEIQQDTLDQPQSAADERPYKIKCICNSTDDDGNKILCEECDTWQHVRCYYPGHGENASREDFEHACVDCSPRPFASSEAVQEERIVRLRDLNLGEEEIARLQNINLDEKEITEDEELEKTIKEMEDEEAIRAKAGMDKSTSSAPEGTKKPIRFKDAVGRKFKFPFHICATWKGMEELIKQAFLNVEVIGPHVAEGHYDLMGPYGEIILPQVWETMIEPDLAITMHMWPMPELPKAHQNPEELAQSSTPKPRRSREHPPPPPPPYELPSGKRKKSRKKRTNQSAISDKDIALENNASSKEKEIEGGLLERVSASDSPWRNADTIHLDADDDAQWTLDRVLTWLAMNNFSNDWQETFKGLNLHGGQFLSLGTGNGGKGNFDTMHQQIYPRLAKECSSSGTGWDQAREREEGKRMRRLIRIMVTGGTERKAVEESGVAARMGESKGYRGQEQEKLKGKEVEL